MKILRALALTLAGSVLLTGCDFDVYSLPLPGGADVGDDPISVTVKFRDVLDLVPKSTVKVNDVDVGQVTDVRLDGFAAEVDIELRDDTDLPDNAVAEIRQTSLLGEKFVELGPPPSGATSNPLGNGDVIPLSRSGRNPEVEEVLGALSLILNGGGVGQLNTITVELNKALEGRESNVRSVLTQIDSFTGQLDTNKAQIVDAIESLNQLALEVRDEQPSIDGALEQLPSALDSLNRQRDGLKTMLQSLDDLGNVAVGVIRRSKADTIRSFQELQPVLTQLSNSGDAFVKAFNVFLTYPFIDEVVGRDPQVARNLHMGDYTNLSVRLDVDLSDLGLPTPSLPTEALPTLPTLPTLPSIPTEIPTEIPNVCKTLADLPNHGDLGVIDLSGFCKKARHKINNCLKKQTVRACRKLPSIVIDEVCQNADLPLLCGTGGGGGGGGGGLPGVPVPVPGVPNLPGGGLSGGGGGGGGGSGGLLGNRVGFGPTASPSPSSGPTFGQVVDAYDPGLATLLIPGMVTQ